MAISAINNSSSNITDVNMNQESSFTSIQRNVAENAAADTTKRENVSEGMQQSYDSEDSLQVENVQNVSSEKVKRSVEAINQKIKATHTSCQYSYHEETNRISIKVIDDDTQEVIREIPPEKTLNMIAKILELEGILVDEKR